MTASYALGTASRSFAVGEPPEIWESPNNVLLQFRRGAEPGYGTLFARYVIDDRGYGAGHTPPPGRDWTDDGVFAGAQHGNRAIVAYGLRPRLRPTRSYKLSVNMLGAAGAEIRVGGAPVDPTAHSAIAVRGGEAVCVAAGDVYVAIIPLEPSDMGSGAPVELHLDGETMTLDICNYRGFAKQFWEHRSQGGPFYKGNIRSAFVLEVAERHEHASLDAFASYVEGAMLADSADDDYVREIAYASGSHSIALRYSLWDMSPVERRFDGVVYRAPMGRAGALDGAGPQFLQSRDSLIALGQARLLAGTTPKWLVADDEGQHYVFVNPSEEEAPVWLETPDTIVECDAFGFGRIELDDATGAVLIEATGDIGTVRVRREGNLQLSINGADVTGSLLRTTEPNVREFRGL
jgi:hypothetical protein